MLLLIDKPQGITSYDVIRCLKPEFPKQKIGHSGTLDPMATGLMIIGTEKDTKNLARLQQLPKTYQAMIDFSQMSDTRDRDYRDDFEQYEISEKDGIQGVIKNNVWVQAPTFDDVISKLNTLIPEFEMPLPTFSAKKMGGEKLYDIARSGTILQEKRMMKIYGYQIVSYDFPYLKVEVTVGSGTYIRSIAYWLGNEFGTGGILSELRRLSVGDYVV